MVRNIPNKYSKESLKELIDQKFEGKYDFFYLPIDLQNKCNLGYAFLNFIELTDLKSFFEIFHSKKWPIFNSEKICQITYARLQGREECEKHFSESRLMKFQERKYQPYIAKKRKTQREYKSKF